MSTANTTSSDGPKRGPQSSEGDTKRPAPAVPKGGRKKIRWLVSAAIVACIVALAGAGAWYWRQQQLHALPEGVARANGRLESEQVEIATKLPGRITVVLAKEGQMVDAGEVVARMDTAELEAQLQAAEAQVRRDEYEQKQAEAGIVQRDSERVFAGQELRRMTVLNQAKAVSDEKLDQARNQMRTAEAAYDTAIASRDAAKATILAAQAEVARLKSQIADSTLVAPVRGRIQYKLAEPGEVLSAGGRVLTLLDLNDVYMTIFLPARDAGPLTIGDEARVTLDPLPGYVFPAKITFVATEAQFTPKTVETGEEREKLMFRIKLTIDQQLREKYENQVKTGIRGIGFVRTKPDVPWPDSLTVKLP